MKGPQKYESALAPSFAELQVNFSHHAVLSERSQKINRIIAEMSKVSVTA